MAGTWLLPGRSFGESWQNSDWRKNLTNFGKSTGAVWQKRLPPWNATPWIGVEMIRLKRILTSMPASKVAVSASAAAAFDWIDQHESASGNIFKLAAIAQPMLLLCHSHGVRSMHTTTLAS